MLLPSVRTSVLFSSDNTPLLCRWPPDPTLDWRFCSPRSRHDAWFPVWDVRAGGRDWTLARAERQRCRRFSRSVLRLWTRTGPPATSHSEASSSEVKRLNERLNVSFRPSVNYPGCCQGVTLIRKYTADKFLCADWRLQSETLRCMEEMQVSSF